MFTLGVTDLRWHDQLLRSPVEGPVNFWTPTLWRPNLEQGSRLFFMLKSPIRKIGGFGYVARYEELSVSDAWQKFGRGNGVESEDQLRDRVEGFAAKRSVRERGGDSPIGCIVLQDSVFLPDELQASPSSLGLEFASQIVKYKQFPGELFLPLETANSSPSTFTPLPANAPIELESRDFKARPDQALFRSNVLRAYGHRCAFLGTRVPQALDAAHIQPFMNAESNHIQNGIALRKDVHSLFDAGLLALDDDYSILVSPLISQKPYVDIAGRKMRLPTEASQRPSIEALRLHRKAFRTGPV